MKHDTRFKGVEYVECEYHIMWYNKINQCSDRLFLLAIHWVKCMMSLSNAEVDWYKWVAQ